MAQFGNTFDATGVAPAQTFELLPPGSYKAQIVDSELRVTRNGTGKFLWIMLDILEGPYRGRKLFDQLNLVNPNPITVEMAQRTLSSICHAVGQLQVTDSEQLHLKPMTIAVSIEPAKNGYGERNRIRYLVPKSEEASAAQPATPAPLSTPRPLSAPWARKG